jgi:DNA-directed RNA polymerase subunit RPC12/RpoP
MAYRCAKCGTTFDVSLTLFDKREVKVAHCRVCPPSRVYAVCAKCADLASTEQGPCPSCGARNMWSTQGMVPVS